MPHHLSTIGFPLAREADLAELAEAAARRAHAVPVRHGTYLRWAGTDGEELWLQLDRQRQLIGMVPHYAGKSAVRIGVTARVSRPSDTSLDGALHGWADPEGDSAERGAYPLVFDLPDAATYVDFAPPAVVEAQIAAFAHELEVYPCEAAYDAAQPADGVKFAAQSFVPLGLFDAEGGVPSAMAMFTGVVVESAARRNAMTGAPYYWALVRTLAVTLDVVIDASLLAQAPAPGAVLSGHYWLSGRLTRFPPRPQTWYGRLLGALG